MLDAPLRRIVDPGLSRLGRRLARLPLTANALTVASFVCGMAGVAAIALHRPLLGLAFIAGNRLLDGLDGPLARATVVTDFGAFLDIVLDFIFYASVPFAFALADPSRALAASFLILSFVGTGTSFLAFAVFAAKRGLSTEKRGAKSFYHLGGLTEGTETFIAFAIACIWPEAFSLVAYVFGTLCFVTTGGRIAFALETLT